jgi:hypothetical protein
MKRFLILGALALATASLSLQEASAWINSRFGIGANWGWQSGNNDFLHGLFHSGSPCGPDITYRHVPVYPQPCCCTANVVTLQQQPHCCCGAAPAPMAAPAPCATPVQSFRYQPVNRPYYR